MDNLRLARKAVAASAVSFSGRRVDEGECSAAQRKIINLRVSSISDSNR
jgi:hypothetical protein